MSYKDEAFDFLGITQWHELGYKGKGIKIMSGEKIQKKAPNGTPQELWDKVICPSGYKTNKDDHGSNVMRHILAVCPEAECIALPFNVNADGKGYKSTAVDYILENNVTMFTTSYLFPSISEIKKKAMRDCIEKGCTFFVCSGNGESDINEEAKAEEYICIGGVKPRYKNGKYDWNDLYHVSYSNEGEEIDYTTIAEVLGSTGTSFFNPLTASMCVLVQEFFLEKTGRTLNRSELTSFINDNLLDVDKKGFDVKTGHGLFILPDPNNINIKKYVGEEVKMDKYIVDIIPKNKINRSNLFFVPTYITIHNTDNYNKGANAKAHGNYLKNVDSKVSWHYTVDDTYIVQHLSDNECGYHTGDGMSEKSGNRNSIGVEICVNKDGDLLKATENAVELVKKLMKAYNIPIENVVQHYHWSGKDCPHELRLGNPYSWETFINKIKEGKPMEEVSDWAKEAQKLMKELEISDGLRPRDSATREEIWTMLSKIYKLLKK